MSYGGPTKYCPRCNTLLPAEAQVCSTCGLQFGVNPAFTPPGASGVLPGEQFGPPESWSQPQPGWPSTAPGAVSQGLPGAVGYAPAPVAAPPKQVSNRMLLIGLAVVIAIIAAAFFINAYHSSSPAAFDRHGLQENVPLPNNPSFYSMKTFSQGGITGQEWIWLVNNDAPASVQQFYQEQLPNNGWKNVRTATGSDNTLSLAACQGSQVLIIGVSQHLQDINAQGTPAPTVDAPQGGSALGIILSSNQELLQALCPGL